MRDWYDRYFLWIDLGVCILITGVAIGVGEWRLGHAEVDRITSPNRQALYTAIASTAGALLGFIIAAASIVVPLSTLPQFRVLRLSGHYASVFGVYSQAMLWLALATLGAFIGLLLDTKAAANVIAMYAIGFLFLIAGARVFQCIRMLNLIIGVLLRTPESAYPRSA